MIMDKQYFFVKRLGYDHIHSTWVEEKDLNTKDIIEEYLKLKNVKI